MILFAAILWFIHGFGANELSAIDYWRLKRSFLADKVISVKWCASDSTWSDAVTNAEKASRAIVAEVQSMRPELRKNLILVGHSLGGRVLAHSLAKLGRLGTPVKTAVLLAPAISVGDKEAEKMDAGCSSLIIVAAENDYVLGFLYPLVAGEYAETNVTGFCTKEGRCIKYEVPDWFANRYNDVAPSHNVSVHIEYLELARSGVPISSRPENPRLFVDLDRCRLVNELAADSNIKGASADAFKRRMELENLNRQLNEMATELNKQLNGTWR